MNLPAVKNKALIEDTLCGLPITIRHMTVEDSLLITDKVKDVVNSTMSNIMALAYLMTGYDEDYETRLAWLKSLNPKDFSDLAKINDLLGEAGMHSASTAKKK